MESDEQNTSNEGCRTRGKKINFAKLAKGNYKKKSPQGNIN